MKMSTNVSHINIRVDQDLKEEFTEVMDNLGLSVSSAFTVFMKAAVRDRGIPFKLTLRDGLNEAEREAEQMLNDPNTHWYKSVAELAESEGWFD